jgi:hypothetical protein
VTFRLVEQIGDLTFALAGPTYPCLPTAMLALVDLAATSDDDRDLFVDGPGLENPIGVGQTGPQTN